MGDQSQSEKKSSIHDQALNRILNDKTISEYERMEAVRFRADQIEQRANMEEAKLRNKAGNFID